MPLPKLDVRLNKNIKKRFVCSHVFPELTAVCPVTRLPDFYTVAISYEPDKKLVELKSLKIYLIGYRNIEILHEEITNQIFDDLIKATQPRWASIEVKVNVRGGVATTVTRHWSRQNGDEIVPPYFSAGVSPR